MRAAVVDARIVTKRNISLQSEILSPLHLPAAPAALTPSSDYGGLAVTGVPFRRKADETMAANPESASPEQGLLLIDERRQHILSLIQSHGRALVRDLSRSLNISQITIRKDLEYLQNKGLVQRTHGGALRIQSSALLDPTLKEKQKQHSQEKQRIATAAVRMVEEGQCVMLDSGTTTTAIAHELKSFSQLTVITNFEVILIGGSLRKNSFSLVGPLAEDVLQEMHADILFLGVDGFDPEVGLTTPNFLESRVNRAMVKAARRVVAVCDSTKFNRRSLSRIVLPSAIHCVITDRGLPLETAEILRAQNIEVVLV
jgi:DeoR family transcriptional regulator of aga operon